MSRRAGFTIVELMMVLVILGILAMLGGLKYIDLRDKAVAAGISSELNAVRLAAYNFWADHESWPAEAGPGVTPPELVQLLPGGFSFSRPAYTMDWENFVPAAGAGPASGGLQIGLVVTSQSASLTAELARVATSGAPFIVQGNTLTFIIVGPNGAM